MIKKSEFRLIEFGSDDSYLKLFHALWNLLCDLFGISTFYLTIMPHLIALHNLYVLQ